MTGKYENWSLALDQDGILWLTLDKKESSANILNEPIFREFSQILNGISQGTQAKALVIQSNKPTGFILGADISQFKNIKDKAEAKNLILQGQEVFNKLENLSIPTIALISGYCLGGGLELALACRYRIIENSEKTRLGLPEVKLGIHPGWGGTVRLIDLIGAPKAMDMILTGRMVSSKQAKKMGLVNEAVPKRVLVKAAIAYAKKGDELVKANWVKKGEQKLNTLINQKYVRSILAKVFYKQLKSKISQDHYPAPFKVVENWEKLGTQRPEALLNEADSMAGLLFTDTSQNLIRVFFLQEQLKGFGKGIEISAKHVHVVGCGVMGGDIAVWCALKGFKVTMQDQSPELIKGAIKRGYELANKQLKERHLIQAMMDRLIPDPDGHGVPHADVIIEAITEKLEAKQNLFKQLEGSAKNSALLATNTSTIPLEEIAKSLKNPSRLIGIHFFNPVSKMPLVEVIKGTMTTVDEVKQASAFVAKIDKLPLVVKSSPGFLVNRILLPYMMEAVSLLNEGVSGPTIDKIAKEFGMPMGPIELADVVGLDVCLNSLEKLAGHFGGVVPEELRQLVKDGKLGKKTGEGFYRYDAKGKMIAPQTVNSSTIAPLDIIERLSLRMLNEAVACLREGIVQSGDLLDAGCIFGFGFPPFKGGPIHYAQKEGGERLVKQLQELEKRYGKSFAADQGWSKVEVA